MARCASKMKGQEQRVAACVCFYFCKNNVIRKRTKEVKGRRQREKIRKKAGQGARNWRKATVRELSKNGCGQRAAECVS